MIRRVRPRSALRNTLLALLPGLLAAVMIALTFSNSLSTLTDDETSWTGHPYQMLSQQIALVSLGHHQPPTSASGADIPLAQEIAMVRSSFKHSAVEFKELAAVEALGPARLARVRQLFERGVQQNDPVALHAALLEANALNAQARVRLQFLREEMYDQIRSLQLALAISGALAVMAIAAVIGRFVDLWRYERQLRAQQQKLTRELSLMASHELRRPLQQLALVADLLQNDDLIGETERARLFQRLQDSAAQLAVLSDLSRLDAVYATPELNRAPRDLAELLAPLAGPRVAVEFTPGVTWNVDPVRFRQSVENVLENALKYSPANVRLELRQGEGGPEVHIVDRGPGVPPQDRERVFEPFYRVPGGGVSGHGLGLAIARRFMRAHGGDITLRDEPGGGTRAVITLTGAPEERAVASRGRREVRDRAPSRT